MPSGDFNRLKTHCPQGHEYTPENTVIKIQRGGYINRNCKECRNEYRRRARQYQRWYG